LCLAVLSPLLSYRDVEEPMAERGIILTYEAVPYWCRTFGQADANQLRRRNPRPGDKWYLDEVFLTIHGERLYLRRAVDQDSHVLDILVQRRRDKNAAKKFCRLYHTPTVKKLCDQGASYCRGVINDGLCSTHDGAGSIDD
jgi:transposase-like protein